MLARRLLVVLNGARDRRLLRSHLTLATFDRCLLFVLCISGNHGVPGSVRAVF